MAAYILRRLLLIVPTLIGIMLVNFTLTQFVPGGPIEQIAARLQGEGDVFRNIAGGGDAGGIGNSSRGDGGCGGGESRSMHSVCSLRKRARTPTMSLYRICWAVGNRVCGQARSHPEEDEKLKEGEEGRRRGPGAGA